LIGWQKSSRGNFEVVRIRLEQVAFVVEGEIDQGNHSIMMIGLSQNALMITAKSKKLIIL
jgi:hypothetical protein